MNYPAAELTGYPARHPERSLTESRDPFRKGSLRSSYLLGRDDGATALASTVAETDAAELRGIGPSC
jgi:hypothetical protein